MTRTAAAMVPVPKRLLGDPTMQRVIDRRAHEAFTAIAQGANVHWDTLRHLDTVDADSELGHQLLPPEMQTPNLVVMRFTAEVDTPILTEASPASA